MIENYIRGYDNAIPDEYCDDLIKRFDANKEAYINIPAVMELLTCRQESEERFEVYYRELFTLCLNLL